MKKLVIGLLVVVMALGTMGVAFATNMDFDDANSAIMAQGFNTLPDVDCTYIDFSGGTDNTCGYWGWYWYQGRRIYADEVEVQFDTDLLAGTMVEVAVTETDWEGYKGYDVIAEGSTTLLNPVSANTSIFVPLKWPKFGYPIYFNEDLNRAEYINVRVIGSGGGHAD